MKSPLILLFTRDRDFAGLVCEALSQTDAVVLIARDVRDGLQIVHQRGRELDFAVMDFDDSSRGRTLLSAIHTCYERLPILVTSSEDSDHADDDDDKRKGVSSRLRSYVFVNNYSVSAVKNKILISVILMLLFIHRHI